MYIYKVIHVVGINHDAMYRVDPAYKIANEWNCKYTHIQTILPYMYLPQPRHHSSYKNTVNCLVHGHPRELVKGSDIWAVRLRKLLWDTAPSTRLSDWQTEMTNMAMAWDYPSFSKGSGSAYDWVSAYGNV